MEKSGEKMMKKRETEVGESSSTSSGGSNIWGSSWEFVEQGITTPLLNLFSFFFTSKTATTQPTTTTLSPPQTKSTVISLYTFSFSFLKLQIDNLTQTWAPFT
ncbi:hypothetical protein LguiA_003261 [Lonicera macranthoides]